LYSVVSERFADFVRRHAGVPKSAAAIASAYCCSPSWLGWPTDPYSHTVRIVRSEMGGAERVAAPGDGILGRAVRVDAALRVRDTLHYGGTLWEQDFTQTVGCTCGAGFQRTTATAAPTGSGSCNIVGFTTSDPGDCRVNVHVHTDAWFFAWGDCSVTVNKDPRPDSCNTRCGGSALSCWCDSLCTGFGDCCSDYTGVCLSAIELRLQGVARSSSDGLLHLSVANNGRRGTLRQVVCTMGNHTVGRDVSAFLENGQTIDVT